MRYKIDPESRNVLLHKVEQYETFHFHKYSGTTNISSSRFYFMYQNNSLRSSSLKDMKERNQYFPLKQILKYRSLQPEASSFSLRSCQQAQVVQFFYLFIGFIPAIACDN